MTSPLELLTPKNREPRLLTKLYGPIACGTLGFTMACTINFMNRRPVFSGIQKHIGLTLAGGLIGQYVEQRGSDYYAEKDAVLRHYIELHPEDFPAPERQKFADVLWPWVPIR